MTEEYKKQLEESGFDFHIWNSGLCQLCPENTKNSTKRRKMKRQILGYDELMIARNRSQKSSDMDEACRQATSDYQSLNPPQKPASVSIYG